MEVQRRILFLFHIFLSFFIHTQILAVDPLKQASPVSVDLKPYALAVETMLFPVDLERRELAGGGGGGSSGGGGSRGGSSGGSSGGGSRGGSSGGRSGGGGSGGSGGKGGNRGGSGGRGGGGRGDDGDDDSGGGGGDSGNSGGGGGGRQAPVFPVGRFPSHGVRIQYSVGLLITCFLIMYH